MRRHAPFEPIDPYFCVSGGVADIINCANFLKIRQRVSELSDPEKRHFPLTSFIALTTCWTSSWILKMPRGENQSTRRILELHDIDYWKMQRTDCYQTLQDLTKKLVSATGLYAYLLASRFCPCPPFTIAGSRGHHAVTTCETVAVFEALMTSRYYRQTNMKYNSKSSSRIQRILSVEKTNSASLCITV